MQSIKVQYMAQLLKGKPIHLNWLEATKSQIDAVKALVDEGIIHCTHAYPHSTTAVYNTKRNTAQ